MLRSNPTSQASDENQENGVMVVTHHIDEMFNLPSFLTFSNEDAKRILISFNSRISRVSYTEAWQQRDLAAALDKVQFQNEFLKTVFAKAQTKQILLNLMLYGKYIFDYKTNPVQQELYISKFKENFSAFQESVEAIVLDECLKALSSCNEADFVQVIPLACHHVFQDSLASFRSGELMGHDVAYKLAQNEGKIQRLVVKDKNKKIIQAYAVKEIIVKINGTDRDKGLIGSILVPEYDNGPIPENPRIYINWAGTHSAGTIQADMERSAGEESYRRSEDQILNHIVPVISAFSKQCNKPIKLIFTGHSLGGALAQLCYHSCQRIIALSIDNPDTQLQVKEFEKDFADRLKKTTSFDLSLLQKSIDDIKLSKDLISEMSVEVWNPAGVLEAVEISSNNLSLLLSQYIAQRGHFGHVGGDVVQATGQGTILSDAGKNGARVTVLKVEPDTPRMWTNLIGPAAGGVSGSILLSAIGLSTPVGAAVGVMLICAATAKAKMTAHTMKHFENSSQPQQPHHIYTSHHPDGTLNEHPETGYKKVQEELRYKSPYLIDVASSVISHIGPQSRFRLQADITYQENRFALALAAAEKRGPDNLLPLLITEMTSGTTNAEARVKKAAIEKELFNAKDKDGKTLLHHAIEKGKFTLATELLNINGIDVNQCDEEGNSPLTSLMSKMNDSLLQNKEIYEFGKLLLQKPINLSLENKKGESAATIFKTWKWYGVLAREFCNILSAKLSGQAQQPQLKP